MMSRLLPCVTAAMVFASFSVASHAGSMTFAVVGDYGDVGHGSRYVADMITGTDWDPAFILTTGDNSYRANTPEDWDAAVGQYYGDYIEGRFDRAYVNQTGRTQRFYPTLGNHDLDSMWEGNTNAGFVDYFHSDPGSPSGRLPSGVVQDDLVYYDFQQGDVHVFVLDSIHAGEDAAVRAEQQEWLKDGLAESTATWKFVSMHHSPYSSGYHGDQEFMQWAFEDWGVDAVFSGHDHDYERSNRFGVPYFVSGLGGKSRYGFETDGFYSRVRYNRDYGAMRVSVEDDVATFQFVSIDDGANGANGGTVIDSYTIDKNAPAPSYTSLVPRGAIWSYLDDSSDQGTTWKEIDFLPDESWRQGPAELGYGDGDEATVVDCGPNGPECDSGNYWTTYFRTTFDIDASSLQRIDNLVLELIRDDGAAVYLNGVEVARDRLARDADYNDPALSRYPSEWSESAPIPMFIDHTLLRAGTNVIAAEVHQESSNSDDLSFDLQLTARLAWEYLAGDANQDGTFDQLDLVQVLQAGKYLSGQTATWGEGDWNGASGDRVFDQLDIVQALAAGTYLAGPYGPNQASAVLAPIPEPSTLLLVSVALAGILTRRVRAWRTPKQHNRLRVPCETHNRPCPIPAVSFLLAVTLATVGHADILRWDTGEVIPGTEGIVVKGGVDLIDMNLEFADFRGANLHHADLQYSRFRGADFTGAGIEEADFTGVTQYGFTLQQLYSTASFEQGKLYRVRLDGNDLAGADFGQQNLTYASLASTQLTGASFHTANLNRAYLQNSQLSGVDFRGAYLSGATLSRADLHNADFRGANITSAHFVDTTSRGFTAEQLYSTENYKDAYLHGISLSENDLSGWNFAGMHLEQARFNSSDLSGADLSNADLERADFTGANLNGAIIHGVNLLNASGFTAQQLHGTASYGQNELNAIRFDGVDLSGVDFTGKDLSDTSFYGTNLSEAVFRGAKLNNTDLRFARLDDADLANVNVSGQDLHRASLSGADLRDANLYETTLNYATLSGATLAGSDLRDAEIRDALLDNVTSGGFTAQQLYSTATYQKGQLLGVSLNDNDLAGWDFSGQRLSGASFQRANLSGADFNDASLSDAILADANMSGARIRGTKFAATVVGGFTAEQLYSTASYQEGELVGISFAVNNLTGWDFSEQDLTDAVFSSTRLDDADLGGATLQGASLAGASLVGANLAGADLSETHMAEATLTGANLEGGRFVDANLRYANLSDASARRADLTNANLKSARLQHVDLTDAMLLGTNMEYARMSGVNLQGADLRGASFQYAYLDQVDFTGADVRGADLAHTTEHGFVPNQLYLTASYQQGDLAGIDLSSNDLSGWNLSGKSLSSASFVFSDLTGATMSSADLSQTSFDSATLAGTNLSGANLTGASFHRTTLSSPNFNGANLTDATFTRAKLSAGSFRNANLSGVGLESIELAGVDFHNAIVAGARLSDTTGGGLTAEQLYSTASYQQGDLQAIQLSRNDLSGWNLAAKDLTGAYFDGSVFAGANLNEAILTRASFQGARISEANVTGAEMTGANVERSTLSATNLNSSTLDGATFERSSLTEVDLSGTSLDSVTFTSATLNRVNFLQADLTDAVFRNAVLSESSLRGTTLTNATFEGATLDEVDFHDADIRGVNLRGATSHGFAATQLYDTASYQARQLTGVNLQSNDLTGLNLAAQDFAGSSLRQAILTGANLSDTDLQGVSLDESTLAGADLRRANLTGADLHRATLSSANLSNANLTRADLSLATLADADFTGASIAGIELGAATDRGFTASQLYSTASYQQGDLSGIGLRLNDLSGWNFAGKNLSNAYFVDSTLSGADLSGADLTRALLHRASLNDADLSGATLVGASLTQADLRGALGFDADTNGLADAANMIGPDGNVMGLRLQGSLNELIVQDHRLPITVSESLWMDKHSRLELVLTDGDWGSTIQIADGISPQLGGSLALTVASDADIADMLGATFDLFDWNSTLEPDSVFDSIYLPDNTVWDLSDLYVTGDVVLMELQGQFQAGDADQDFDFDQLDLVKVQQAGKYLTGQSATWGEGDWDAAPGGSLGAPPEGDGVFDQLDIVAALQGGVYLTGHYAAIASGGQREDGQTSVVYDTGTGELAIDTPAGSDLTSVNIQSASGVFTGSPAEQLGGDFDIDANSDIFKATFGSSFGSLSFGNVAPVGLSEQFVLQDLTVVGSLVDGGGLGEVDLVYVPEPTSVFLLVVGLVVGLLFVRRAKCRRWDRLHTNATPVVASVDTRPVDTSASTCLHVSQP